MRAVIVSQKGMRTSSSARWVCQAMATLFAASATLYSVLWIMQVKYSIPQPGFTDYEYSATARTIRVGRVIPASPADRAGLRQGDRIVAIEGQKLATLRPFYEEIILGHKEIVALTVEQPERAAGQPKSKLEGVFLGHFKTYLLSVGGGKHVPKRTMRLDDLLGFPLDYYPVCFLIVAVAVLLLRPDDRNTWLLALLFGGFVAVAPTYEGNVTPSLRGFIIFYKIVMCWSSLALFYYFFAVFPASSPIDRKIPWLKYLLLAVVGFTAVPIAVRCLIAGGTLPLYMGLRWPGVALTSWILTTQAGLPAPVSRGWPSSAFMFLTSFVGSLAFGLASLISNAILSADPQVRRKARVMVWGTVIGVAPVCLVAIAGFSGGNVPLPMWQLSILLLLSVWPLSFAYAVVKHRVLEIPVLLKRSARYVLVQRGYFFILLVVAIGAIVVFARIVMQLFSRGTSVGMAISALFGIVLVRASAPIVKRGTERIDRAFFRSAYDARLILQDLAQQARGVTERKELANLLVLKIEGALHPKSVACYLETGTGSAIAGNGIGDGFNPGSTGSPQPGSSFRLEACYGAKPWDRIPADLPLVKELAQHGRACDFPQSARLASDTGLLAECLVPLLGRTSRPLGLLILGQRRSEEPYSGEDKQLLDSVAGQAGVTLENIGLAEAMAARMEAERRTAAEMDIARRVQARLFPQKLPTLKTLEYAGGCIQAREVGGDYYDFLDMGPGAMGIVLADISGKGISGALLMANLQANLRTQYAIALNDLPHLLKSVNRLFCENTTEESYATMFFGLYKDDCRTLRYANCGHVAPIILRASGTIQRLASTTTVVGLFLDWRSPIEEEKLAPGDLLIIYTDGVSEAPNPQGEEYGDSRLTNVIQQNRALPVDKLLATIQQDVQQFSASTQADDITVIVARCHEPPRSS